ncbi:hypothetical protein IKE67_04905 [bacterium]|nr:hypothetical protein [bacterium]
MSNFIVPNTFVPGTKAKAQEVNENFVAVQNELNQKLVKGGDSTQPLLVGEASENNHAVQKIQLQNSINNLASYTESVISPFMIKSGNIDEDGEPDILDYENGVLSFKVDNGTLYAPIVAVPANLQAGFTVNELSSIDLSSYSDGVYNVFLKSNSTAYVLNNTISIQKVRPETPSLNDIFVDISTNPITAEKYNGESWETFNDVYLGNVTLASGEITAVENNKFNDNGSTPSNPIQTYIVETYVNAYSGYVVYSNGLCEQWGFLVNVSDSQVVSLMKEYKNGAYNVQLASAVASGINIHSVKAMTGTGNKSTSSFKIVKRDSSYECFYWYTVGYLF